MYACLKCVCVLFKNLTDFLGEKWFEYLLEF